MDLDLRDTVVVITAGATGIGRACAEAFLAEGARVAFCSRRESVVREAEEAYRALGGDVLGMAADAAEEEAMFHLAEAAHRQWGRLDVWLNNAAMDVRKPILECGVEDFDAICAVNQRSVFVGTKVAAAYMRRNPWAGKGVIVNTSSFSAQLPTAGNALYSMTKAAVDNFTACSAAELAPLGIRVLGVAPGPTHSPWNDPNLKAGGKAIYEHIALRRFGNPGEIAQVALFLASSKSSFMTGTTVTANGGRFSVQNVSAPWEWEQKPAR